MTRKKKNIRMAAILAIVFILVGCTGPTAVVSPTQDIPSVRTESAKTVIAKITIEAALNPTATTQPTQTPVPPTPTEPPTSTPLVLPPTVTPIATSRPVTSGGAVYPTATRRSGPDQANLISQDPKDGAVFHPGNEFDGTWTFKNIGTSTWTTGFEYRFAGGTNLAKKKIYTVPSRVAPGETIKLITDMVAPSTGGRYVSNWELVNENGDVFYQFFMVIDVK